MQAEALRLAAIKRKLAALGHRGDVETTAAPAAPENAAAPRATRGA